MGAVEIISLIANALLSSGLIYTIMFFKQKQRKEDAEASQSEHTSDATAIQNVRASAVEWREIAEARDEENKQLKQELREQSKLVDRLYIEKGEDRKLILSQMRQLTDVEIKAVRTHCDVKRCPNRNPPTGY